MNQIHPTAIIEKGAQLGKGNYIGPNCYIGNGVIIGDGNRFDGYCSIGTPPEHRDHWKGGKGVSIGNGCVIREFTTINSGCTRLTTIRDKVVMLRGSHVGHDGIIEAFANISCNVLVGGYTIVMQGANLGLGSIVHQNHVVGPYAMLGMGCVVPKKIAIEPFNIYVGNPAKFLKTNKVGIERAGLTLQDMDTLRKRYENLISNADH